MFSTYLELWIPRKLQINYKNKVLEIDSIFRTAKNGKTLVYLHCGAGSKEDFQPIFQSRELESYGILAFDFPGCGNSSYPEDSKIEVIDLRVVRPLKMELIQKIK